MPRRYTPEPVSITIALSVILGFAIHPGTNPNLLLWARHGPVEGLLGTLTYSWSHASWLHVALNIGAIVVFGQLLGHHRSRLVCRAAVAGAIGGAIAFHFAVALDQAGLALQGASSLALAIVTTAAVVLPGIRRITAVAPIALAVYPIVVDGTWFAHVGGSLAGLAVAFEYQHSLAKSRPQVGAQFLHLRKVDPQ